MGGRTLGHVQRVLALFLHANMTHSCEDAHPFHRTRLTSGIAIRAPRHANIRPARNVEPGGPP